MFMKWILIMLVAIVQNYSAQEEEGPYWGKFIGKLNSYHHQVSGDVYAVDERTILLVNFNYDGTGDDTFFWAGDSGRPGPQGFIVPDQHGKTNILERYYNEEVQLTLPEGKHISRLKWFAIYDVASQNAFGDVFIPDDFEAPAERAIGPLVGDRAVSSQSVRVIDAATILIPEFKYDGSGGEVYFWTGVGPQPSPRGYQIPDEYGYLEPLGQYTGEDVRLELPGGKTVNDIKWISVWDQGASRSLAAVLVPAGLSVPPSTRRSHPYKSSLPHCKQLHRDLQVSWEVFGSQVTIELAGKLEPNEYMSFGISGSTSSSKMQGADVAVAQYSPKLQRALAADYNISAQTQCIYVLGSWQGVCRDDRLGGIDDNQVLGGEERDGITRITYRRSLSPSEAMDHPWSTEGLQYVVWAVGALDYQGEPGYHRLYPRRDISLQLGASRPASDCYNFTTGGGSVPAAVPWERAALSDPALRVFTFAPGPAGGPRGVWGRRPAPAAVAPLAFYVNGQLAPDITLRRGLRYEFKILGGNDPHLAANYHPVVVTADPAGGLQRDGEAAMRARRVLGGVLLPRRGRLLPAAAAGPPCRARRPPGWDSRRDASFPTFRSFNKTLTWQCGAPPASLAVAPNSSWPDLVYYNSFTHAGMGGRIFVVDRHRRSARRDAATSTAPLTILLGLALLAALGAWCRHC